MDRNKPADSLPTEVSRFGALLGAYHSRPFMYFIFSVMFLIMGTILSLTFKAAGTTFIEYVLFGALFLGMSILMLYLGYIMRCKVCLYDGGIAVYHKRRWLRMAWDEVASLTSQVILKEVVLGMGPTFNRHVLKSKEGDKLEFGGKFENLAEFLSLLEGKVAEQVLPRYRRSLKRGESLYFGKLTLSRDWLHNDQETIGWNEIQGAEVADGFLRIYRHGNGTWHVAKYGDAPNAFALLELIAEKRGAW